MLLEEWPTVLSDHVQTYYGRSFWRTRMAFAVHNNFKVGLANMEKNTIDWFDITKLTYSEWINSHANAWSLNEISRNFRFVISRK